MPRPSKSLFPVGLPIKILKTNSGYMNYPSQSSSFNHPKCLTHSKWKVH